MRYTVVLESTQEKDQPGWYYAHVPALDLTTHGFGVEGALQSAKDLVTGWLAEMRQAGQAVESEGDFLVSHIEVPDNAVHAA